MVVELGDVADADLEALASGTGRVADEVEEVMRLVRERYGTSHGEKTLVPIVAVYVALSDE
jgi:hypothetical protein